MKRAALMLPLMLLTLVLLPLSVYAQQQPGQGPPPAGAEPGVTHHPQSPHGTQDGSGMSGQGMSGHGMHGSGKHGGQGGMMSQQCKEMKAKHDQMMTEMKLMDTRLDEKIAAMNAADQGKKMAAMADVINELAAQRKQLHEHFANMPQTKMCEMMAKRMGGSGQQGMGHQQHGGMSGGCPMMQKHQGSHGGQHGGSGSQDDTETQSGTGHQGHTGTGSGADTT